VEFIHPCLGILQTNVRYPSIRNKIQYLINYKTSVKKSILFSTVQYLTVFYHSSLPIISSISNLFYQNICFYKLFVFNLLGAKNGVMPSHNEYFRNDAEGQNKAAGWVGYIFPIP